MSLKLARLGLQVALLEVEDLFFFAFLLDIPFKLWFREEYFAASLLLW